jgi:hypothetical protein
MNVGWLSPFGGIKKQLVWAYIGYGRHANHLSISISRMPKAFNKDNDARWRMVSQGQPLSSKTWKSADFRYKLER